MLVTILGGALGVNLYFLLFFPRLKRNGADYNDYHAMKDHYSFWRILAFVMLALDVFLIAMAYETGVLDFSSVRFPQLPSFPIAQKLDELNNWHIPLLVWLGLVNIVTFIAFGVDKYKAESGDYRIPEIKLYLLSAIGGSIGAIWAMKVFHHKTHKRSFYSGIPLFLLLNIITVIYMLYRGWA